MTPASKRAEPADGGRPDWVGQRLEVEVESVAHGGHCVARHEGRVVFVRHALPGERVTAEITEDRGGSFCRADAVQVLRASPQRVDPPCPLARPAPDRPRCGGCDWQHATPAEQRRLKGEVVAEQLRRIAGVERTVEVEELPGGALRWRSRVRLAVDEHGRPGLRAHREHRVVALADSPLGDCPITVEDALPGLLSRRWTPGSELRVTRDGAGTVHADVQRGGRGAQPVRGSGVATEHAAGRSWRVAAHGFWQVHREAAETLAATVREFAALDEGGTAWDLYGGAGLFSGVLAERAGRLGGVLLVESVRRAVADARHNLADLPQVQVVGGRVERTVARDDLAVADPDVVVLDPPRKGAGRGVVGEIARRRPVRVVYVSCDPAALARDIGDFAAHGYRLTGLRAFDAFPMTHHVECVALLERS